MKNLITLLLLTVSTISLSQESTLLRLNYNKGDKYLMQMYMTQKMGEAMNMNMLIEMPLEVKDVNDTIFNTEMSFKRIKMDMNQAGMDITYDSDVKEEEMDETSKMMSGQMKPILETVIAAKTNIFGEVVDMKMIAGNAANADQFTSQTQSVTYPEDAITVGYTWTAEKENNGMIVNSTYTVKSIDDKMVVLDVEGTISGGAKGTLTGNMNIDKVSGVPNVSNINMNMEVMGQEVATDISISMNKTE